MNLEEIKRASKEIDYKHDLEALLIEVYYNSDILLALSKKDYVDPRTPKLKTSIEKFAQVIIQHHKR